MLPGPPVLKIRNLTQIGYYLYVIYYLYVKYRGSVTENLHIGQPVRGPTTIVQICHNQH